MLVAHVVLVPEPLHLASGDPPFVNRVERLRMT
jgi:hypothetical protein